MIITGVEYDVPGTDNGVRKTITTPGEGPVITIKGKVRLLYTTDETGEAGFTDAANPHVLLMWEKRNTGLVRAIRTMKAKEKATIFMTPPWSGTADDKTYRVEVLFWTNVDDISENNDGAITKEKMVEGDPTDRFTPDYESVISADIDGVRRDFSMGDESVPLMLEVGISKMKRGETAVVRVRGPPWVQYEVVLHGHTRVDPLTIDGMPKIAEALKRKNEGNALLKEGLVDRALRKYLRALDFVATERGMVTTEEKELRIKTKALIHNNIALLHMGLASPAWPECIDQCTKSMELDSSPVTNPKAFLRRGAAYRATYQFSESRRDFTALPTSADTLAELQLLAESEKAQEEKARRIFGKVFLDGIGEDPDRRRRGWCKNWNDAKGFGFVQEAETKKEMFVHPTELQVKNQPAFIRMGEEVEFNIKVGADGRTQACKVSAPGGG